MFAFQREMWNVSVYISQVRTDNPWPNDHKSQAIQESIRDNSLYRQMQKNRLNGMDTCPLYVSLRANVRVVCMSTGCIVDSIAYSDCNETSNTLCTLLMLTCHHRYLVYQRIDRSAVRGIVNHSQIFTWFIKQSVVMFLCVAGNNYVRYWLPQACDSVLHSTDNSSDEPHNTIKVKLTL